ncbi:hypothetical protein O181_001727 [Austropuccinia psidii MF-1]|uniref:Uncharacterized protein n=1 Tax=Austropuccinia psidii MF-1 TaxID=1389203 RepID=A0A9Q3GDC1_9BASI|nr:hypothetical protein [Austropuccinia psidii MF-1]
MVEIPYFPIFEWDFLVIDTPKGEYLISGFEFMNNFKTSIYLRQGMITFNPYYTDSSDFSILLNDYVSTSTTCEALSLPHSIDEFFKEMEDFGEDNSISSLHLFHGNVDLPPSSYHDSLEEFWDEEEEPEEIETVTKVVPSA